MSGIRQRLVCGALLPFLLLSLGAASADTVSYAGRPIIDVLAELRGPGLDFIYSSQLLPKSLTVAAEPASTNRLLIAREILAAHGLSLAVVRPGLFAVTARAVVPEHLVRGRIVAVANARAIAHATVRLDPIGAVDWTDEHGLFRIGPVPEGSYTLRVEADGFQSTEISRFLVVEGAADAEFRLAPSTVELGEIVVATSRYGIDRFDGSGAVRIEGEALAAQPAPGEDVMRALARLPGMAQGGLTAQANIRGGETGELLTLLDGFPIREVFHLSSYQDVFGLLDPTLVGDAEVYTGGFPVRYGNRMGGVFDLTTLEPASEPHTALGLSVFNAMARNGGELDARELDWLAMGRVGTLKPFIRTFAAEAGSPSYGDLYARLGWGEASRMRVTANVLWSRDDFEITRESQGERAQFENENRYFWLRGDRIWPNGVEGSLHLGHSSIDGLRVGTIDNPGVASGSATDRRSSKYWDWRGRVAWQPDPRNWIEGGFELIEEDAEYRYAAEASFTDAVAALFSREPAFGRATILTPNRERMAFFAAHRWQALDKLVSELGLRAQRTITEGTTAENWHYDPRLNLRWQFLPSTSVRAHWGRFHQTDEVHELKVEDGRSVFPEAQRSDQTIVGIDHRLGNGLALRLEWFRKLQSDPRPHFENMLDPMSLIPEIAPDRIEVAPLAAEVRGLEVSAASEGRDLDWWAAIAWSEATDNVDGSRVRRSWDQTWAVSAGVDWVHGHWRFGAVAGSHRGWPMTHVEGDELGARNAGHFPVRAALDLRAEYRRPLTVGNLAVTVEVSNAVNVGNACCQQLIPQDDGAGGVTFTTRESDWLPVVPSIGVLWEF